MMPTATLAGVARKMAQVQVIDAVVTGQSYAEISVEITKFQRIGSGLCLLSIEENKCIDHSFCFFCAYIFYRLGSWFVGCPLHMIIARTV